MHKKIEFQKMWRVYQQELRDTILDIMGLQLITWSDLKHLVHMKILHSHCIKPIDNKCRHVLKECEFSIIDRNKNIDEHQKYV